MGVVELLLQIWSGDLRGILMMVMRVATAATSLDGGLLVNELDRIKLSRVTPTYYPGGPLADFVVVLQLGTELLWSDNLVVDVVAWLLLVEDTTAEEVDMLHLHDLVLEGQRAVPSLTMLLGDAMVEMGARGLGQGTISCCLVALRMAIGLEGGRWHGLCWVASFGGANTLLLSHLLLLLGTLLCRLKFLF